MQCPQCGCEMLKGKKNWICEDHDPPCIVPIDIVNNSLDNDIDRIIKTYPTFISTLIMKATDPQYDYIFRCSYLKLAFYWTTKLVALLLIWQYFKDVNTPPSKELQKCLTELTMPTDSTWKNIIVCINNIYKTNDDCNFIIPGFDHMVYELNSAEKGYEKGLTESTITPNYKPLSVFKAAIELRNAIHHSSELKGITNEDYGNIYPYYLDIIVRVLKAFDFLSGIRFKLVSHTVDGIYKILHGDGLLEMEYDLNQEGAVCLFDSQSGRLYNLYPFLTCMTPAGDAPDQFIFENRIKGEVFYIGWNSHSRIPDKDGYRTLKLIMDQKKILLDYDLKDLNYFLFDELSYQLTNETLTNSYLGSKYIPTCYERRSENENIFRNFMSSDKTGLFITGNTGLGKSSFLADIAYRYITGELTETIVIMINARDLKASGDLTDPVFRLLKKGFLWNQSVTSIKQVFAKMNELIKTQAVRGPQAAGKVILIVDAVNEAFPPAAILRELDGYVSAAATGGREKKPYDWLKIIYSFRTTALGIVKRQLLDCEELLANESYYYCVAEEFCEADETSQTPVTEIDDAAGIEKDDYESLAEVEESVGEYVEEYPSRLETAESRNKERVKYTPFVEIKPLTHYEVQAAFSKYVADSTVLSGMEINIKSIDKYLNYLTNPFYLRLFISILEAQKGQIVHMDSRDEIMKKYYEILTSDSEVKHLLIWICHYMVDNNRQPLIMEEDLYKLIDVYEIRAKREGRVFYTNPYEKLISEGVISRKLVYPADGMYDGIVTFTQQRLHEYAIFSYLTEKYGPPSGETLKVLCEKETDFEEYNNAVADIAYKLWDGNQVDEIFQPGIVNQQRYYNVIKNALFRDLDLCTSEKAAYDVQVQIANKYNQRFEKLIKLGPKLGAIKDIEKLLTVDVMEAFDHKESTEPILLSFVRAGKDFMQAMRITDENLCICLNYLAKLEARTGNYDEQRKHNELCLMIARDLSKRVPDNVRIQMILCDCLNGIGSWQKHNGNFYKALKPIEESLGILKQLIAQNPEDIKLARTLFATYNTLGDIGKLLGNLDMAIQNYENSIKTLGNAIRAFPDDISLKKDLTTAHITIGHVNRLQRKIQEAINHYNIGLAIQQELLDMHPEDTDIQHGLSFLNKKYGELEFGIGNLTEARKMYETSSKILNSLLVSNPQNIRFLENKYYLYRNMIDLEIKEQNENDATDKYQECLTLSIALIKKDSQNVQRQQELIRLICRMIKRSSLLDALVRYKKTLASTSELLLEPKYKILRKCIFDTFGLIVNKRIRQEHGAAALLKYKQCLEMLAEINRLFPDPQIKSFISTAYDNIGNLEMDFGNPDKALENYLISLALKKELIIDAPKNQEYKKSLIESYYEVGDYARSEGNLEEIQNCYRSAIELTNKLSQKDPENTILFKKGCSKRLYLGDLEAKAGNLIEALKLYRRNYDLATYNIRKNPQDLEWGRIAQQNSMKIYNLNVSLILQYTNTGLIVEAKQAFQAFRTSFGQLESKLVMSLLNSVLPYESGLYSRVIKPEEHVIVLSFNYSVKALEVYHNDILEIEQITGWALEINQDSNISAARDLLRDILPKELLLDGPISYHIEKNTLAIRLIGELSTDIEQQIMKQFMSITGIELEISITKKPKKHPEVAALLNSWFPEEAGLFKQKIHPNKKVVTLYFLFPGIAEKRFKSLISAFEEASGWRIKIDKSNNIKAAQQILTSIMPEEAVLRRNLDYFPDQDLVTTVVLGKISEESKQDIENQFMAMTGVRLNLKIMKDLEICLDMDTVLETVASWFPAETGLYKKNGDDLTKTVKLYFDFPSLAIVKYQNNISGFEEATGWLIQTNELYNIMAAEKVILPLLPAATEITRKMYDSTKATQIIVELSRELDIISATKLAEAFYDITQLELKLVYQNDEHSPLIDNVISQAQMEILLDAWFPQDAGISQTKIHPGTKTIELFCISPERIEDHCSALIMSLKEVTGWSVAVERLVSSHGIQKVLETLLPAGAKLRRDISYYPTQGHVIGSVRGDITQEIREKIEAQFLSITNMSLELKIMKNGEELLEESNLLELIDAYFPATSGIRSKAFDDEEKKVSLKFNFPQQALRKYKSEIARLEEMSGWIILVSKQCNMEAAQDILDSLLRPGIEQLGKVLYSKKNNSIIANLSGDISDDEKNRLQQEFYKITETRMLIYIHTDDNDASTQIRKSPTK